MPTYEYRCADCRHELEAQQSFDDEPLQVCPSCGGSLKKKFSSVGISFKGSGFYKTDSRTASGSSTKKDAAAKESSSSSDASTSTESKSTDSKSSESKSSGDSGTKAPTAASA